MNAELSQIADLLSCQVYGSYISAVCVFHKDSTPSLLVNDRSYNCLACGAHGSTKSLLNFLQGNPVEKKKIYSPTVWRYMKKIDMEDTSWAAYKHLRNNPSKKYYLRQRKIDSATDFLRIGFMDGYYTFPVFNPQHNVVGMVARAGKIAQKHYGLRYVTPNKTVQPALLYCPNWERVYSSDKVFLVFGILDSISAELAGFPAVTGTIAHNIHVTLFNSLRKPIYILEDGDGKDHRRAKQIEAGLGWRGKVIQTKYPENCKDLNDVLKNFGVKYLQRFLTNIYMRGEGYESQGL